MSVLKKISHFSQWILLYTLLAACSDKLSNPYPPGSFDHADQKLQASLDKQENTETAEGIILFVGDGMSIATVTASRIYAGQKAGQLGEEYQLSFEKFPYSGLSKTYNTNQQTPDSAGTMTAMMTGSKTKAGVISVNTLASRADPESCNGYHLKTLLETAEDQGWASGIVTTTSITHATPAATYAHSPERNWESDKDLSTQAKKKSCRDIASQLIEFDYGNGIEVILGGGRKHFLPESEKGERQDDRHLIQEWLAKNKQSSYVSSADELLNFDIKKTKYLLGLFSKSHLNYEADRVANNIDEPSLTTMVETALQLLQKHKRFLLIVESGRIDHAHHAGNAYRALEETIEFDKAIARANELIDTNKTLMVVTADHSHTMTIAGYPTRGNPILGFVKGNDSTGKSKDNLSLAADNQPYTTLSYANGAGHDNPEDDGQHTPLSYRTSPPKVGRHSTANDNPQAPNYRQEANIPFQSETHAGDDVAVYAQGPWAHLLTGVMEQNYIYHVMKHAGEL